MKPGIYQHECNTRKIKPGLLNQEYRNGGNGEPMAPQMAPNCVQSGQKIIVTWVPPPREQGIRDPSDIFWGTPNGANGEPKAPQRPPKQSQHDEK